MNCTNVVIVVPHRTIECTLERGVGANISLMIEVSGNIFIGAFSYQGKFSTKRKKRKSNGINIFVAPAVVNVTQPSTTGGEITIIGRNFGNDASVVTVEVIERGARAQKTCNNVTIMEDDKIITCILNAGTGKDHSIVITVASQSITSLFSYAGNILLFLIIIKNILISYRTFIQFHLASCFGNNRRKHYINWYAFLIIIWVVFLFLFCSMKVPILEMTFPKYKL